MNNKICCIFINHQEGLYDDTFYKLSNSVNYIDFYYINPNWFEISKVFENIMFRDEVDKYDEVNSGNCIFILLYFKLLHPDYDYYFVHVNDVLFTGDYKILFDKLTNNIYNYDGIIQNDLWYPPKDWIWIKDKSYYNLLDGYSTENCRNLLYKFYCFSKDLVEYIMQGYIDGYYGHSDLCVSCMLESYGGKYDFLINHFKTKIRLSEDEITLADLNSENTILHPVKQKIKVCG